MLELLSRSRAEFACGSVALDAEVSVSRLQGKRQTLNPPAVKLTGLSARVRLGWLGGMLGIVLQMVTGAHGPLHEEIARLTAELEKHPNDPARLVERGELWRVHGLFSEARLDWEKVAALRPADVTNDLRLGLLALGERDTNAASKRLNRFVLARPASLEGHLAAAEADTLARHFTNAIGHWSAAIDLSSEPRPEWFLARARAAQAGGESVDRILESLDQGIIRYGPLPALQLWAVELEVQRGQVDAALARLNALAARAERKERWLVRRGNVLLTAGRTNEARAAFLDARQSLEALPDKLRRAWVATELRQEIDGKLAALAPASDAPHPAP